MNLILAVASLFAAIFPMFTYLLIIWWLDRNEREPFWLLFLNFIWGATGAIILGIIGSILFQIPLTTFLQAVSDGDASKLVELSSAIITAPVVEETTKGLFLLFMMMGRNFDGAVDGVVYGAAIGLGFGMTENFLYFLSVVNVPTQWIFTVIVRTLFSAVMHSMSQATFGFFLGLAKFRPAILKVIFIPTGFLIAVFLHFTWNFTVSFTATTVFGFLILILYFMALFAVFQIALFAESKMIIRELQEESQYGIIPSDHLLYIPYVSRRNKSGWCPQGIPQKIYVQASIRLAFRKNEYRHSSVVKQQEYLRDIEQLRKKIQSMLNNEHKSYTNSQPFFN
jgi:RsiW-degrading membrane proteinase PrsW (M82 family)